MSSTPTLSEERLLVTARHAGVQRSYVDAFGDEREADPRAVRAILAAMGIDVSSDEAAILALEALENRPWLTMLEPVTIVPALVPPAFAIACVPADGEAELFWTFEREDGSHAAGSTLLSNLALLDARSIGGVRYERRTLVLDVAVPAGYHRFLVRVDRREAATTVIATPSSCLCQKRSTTGRASGGSRYKSMPCARRGTSGSATSRTLRASSAPSRAPAAVSSG